MQIVKNLYNHPSFKTVITNPISYVMILVFCSIIQDKFNMPTFTLACLLSSIMGVFLMYYYCSGDMDRDKISASPTNLDPSQQIVVLRKPAELIRSLFNYTFSAIFMLGAMLLILRFIPKETQWEIVKTAFPVAGEMEKINGELARLDLQARTTALQQLNGCDKSLQKS